MRGRALGIHQGWATLFAVLWCYLWGRGQRRNNATYSVLLLLSITSLASHKWFVPFRCWFAGRWVCTQFRTLWVSPTYSSVRLGVSPTATIPTDLFHNQLFCIFSILRWNPGFLDPSHSPAFSRACLSANVGLPMWSASHCLARLVLQLPCCSAPAPLCPSYCLVECFFNSLVVGLLCKCFSGSSVFKLVIFLLLVVGGSEAFLPMSPSWSPCPYGSCFPANLHAW